MASTVTMSARDRSRISILVAMEELIAANGSVSVREIAETVDLKPSTVHHHLKRMAALGQVLEPRPGTARGWRVPPQR